MKNIFLILFIISITFQWDQNTDNPTGYKLYYGKASRQYDVIVDIGNVTEYTLTNIDKTKPMFFAVAAYDIGAESSYSDELEISLTDRKIAGACNRLGVITVNDGVVTVINPCKILPTIINNAGDVF